MLDFDSIMIGLAISVVASGFYMIARVAYNFDKADRLHAQLVAHHRGVRPGHCEDGLDSFRTRYNELMAAAASGDVGAAEEAYAMMDREEAEHQSLVHQRVIFEHTEDYMRGLTAERVTTIIYEVTEL